MKQAFVLFLAGLCLVAGPSWAAVYVIAHEDVTEDALTASDIRSIYLGKKARWNDNSNVLPCRYRRGELHKEFLEGIVQKSATQFRIFWKRAIFTGQRVPFRDFRDEKEMVAYIVDTKGAVGYVSEDPQVEGAKVLFEIR